MNRQRRTSVDLTGKRFGKLQVVKLHSKGHGKIPAKWECICDCGNIKLCVSGALQHGLNISCGCMQGRPTHGDWNLRVRRIWLGMISRCYNTKSISYKNYGFKGIIVCEEWKEYANFKEWAYRSGYEEHLTLDRFPRINGNYEPSNCRWATYKDQANNKSNNRLLEMDGDTKTLQQWSDLYGVNQSRILRRLKNGWSIQEAITTPTDKNKISNKYRKCL